MWRILLNDKTLLHIGLHLKSLQVLNLSCCSEVTDTGIQSICALSLIKKLDIDFCQQLTDTAFLHLMLLKKSLAHLTFSWNPKLTDSIFSYLSEHSVKLRTMEIIAVNGMFSYKVLEHFCCVTSMSKEGYDVYDGFSCNHIKLVKSIG